MGEHRRQASLGQVRLDSRQLDLIVRRIQYLPAPPAVAARLVELASSASAQPTVDRADAPSAMLDLARSDPAMTARIIARANRDGGRAGTVDQAARMLGPDAVQSALLATPPLAAPDGDWEGAGGLDLAEFRRHCVAVGCAAEMLAGDAELTIPPTEAFVCGLLHDIGKLGLRQSFPKSYRRVLEAVAARGGDIADHERRIIGVDHCVFARRLCEHWRLPAAAREASWLHGQPVESIPANEPHRRLIALVGLADAIARRDRIGFSGNDVFVPSVAERAEALDISEAAVRAASERLDEEVRARLAPFGPEGDDAGPHALGQSLAGANVELARINDRLRRQTRALRARAEAFERLAEFTSSLGPDATVGDVLAAAARLTAAGVGHAADSAQPVVAYSADRRQGAALAACFKGRDGTDWRRLEISAAAAADAAGAPTAPARHVLPMLLADQSQVGDWFDPAGYDHRPLTCSGEWIGGVFYPRRGPDPAGAGRPGEVLDALTAGMTLALAMARGRADAAALSERLAGASRASAAARDASAQAKALAAVGEMAAGAAHEINTPLAVISGRAQFMAKQATGEENRRIWRLIADKAHQISRIATALMEFARPRPAAPQALGARAMLRKAAEAFYSSDHPKARASRVDITTGEDLPDVLADEAQIQWVILELITNAANAAGGDPVVRLAAEADETGEAVVFSVADGGPGMDAQTLAGAFTPFFSAQRAGRRSGLGLPTAKRYVENNRGRMWIRSRTGKGTTVYFLLPRA